MRNILKGTVLLSTVVVLMLLAKGTVRQTDAEDASVQPDLIVVAEERRRVGDECRYRTPDDVRHSGAFIRTTDTHYNHAALDVFGCTVEPPCLTQDCFLNGDYFINILVDSPPSSPDTGCLSWSMEGLRQGVWYGKIHDEVVIPPTYSDPRDGAVEKACGVGRGALLRIMWMSCPDIAGPDGLDNKVDLMNDIFGVMLKLGTSPGELHWNPLADINEDGVVDLMNDIWFVISRFGLHCDDFPQME